MATRLYWNDKIPDYNNWGQSWPTFWNMTSGSAYYGTMLDTVKGGTQIVTNRPTFNSFGTSYSILLYRGITKRLLPQTIDGTFDATFLASQGLDTTNAYTRVMIYILDVTGNPHSPPASGYLLNNYDETTTGTEWPVHVGFSIFSSKKLLAPVTLTPITIPNNGRNYRLVVEFGAVSTSTGSQDVGTRLGVRSESDWTTLPDLTVPAGPGSIAAVGYFDFSANIQFAPAVYPAANHDLEYAIDVGSLPISYQVASTDLGNAADVVTDRWYKCLDNDESTTLSLLSCFPGDPNVTGTNNLWTYTAKTPVDGPPFRIGVTSTQKKPVQISMLKDGAVYWRLYLGFGVVTNVSVVKAPSDIQPGDIFINSDSGAPGLGEPDIPSGMPSTWYHPDGTLSGEIEGVVYAELGAMLGNGKFAIPNGDELFIYSAVPSVVLTHRVYLGDNNGFLSSGSDMKDFYVLISLGSGSAKLVKISDAGIIDSKIWMLEDVGDWLKNLSVSRDSKILYVSGYLAAPTYDAVIYRHDLVADVPLNPFPNADTVSGNAYTTDILVMSDGTIVTTWDLYPTEALYHYATDGTVLHTWPLLSTHIVDHISYHGSDDPDKVWIWFQGQNPRYIFRLMNIVTGATVSEFSSNWLNANVGAYDPDCDPTDRFGPGSSCTFLTMMIPKISPANPSGIYQVKRGKTNDTVYKDVLTKETEVVKIPDPFVKTSLIGS